MESWKDYIKNHDQSARPLAEVKIKHKKFEPKELLATYVEVCSSIGNEASTCVLELRMACPNFEKNKGSLNLSKDFTQVQVGANLEVSLGFDSGSKKALGKSIGKSSLDTVFKGYVSSFDIEINNNNLIILTIQGMDAKLWMMTSKKTELKKEQNKYSQIVQNIYNDYAGKLEGKEIKILNEVAFESEIYQQDESDYEFLSRISMLTGCMFFISLGKLYFVSLSALKSPKMTFSPCEGIYNLKISVNIWGIPKTVEVVSTDAKDYQNIISAEASHSDMIGSGKTASSLSSNISSVNTIKIIDDTISSVNEAKFLAEAVYNQRDLNLVELNLEILGCPSLQLGTGVKVKGFGDPIDNTYIIAEIRHYCDVKRLRYTTNLKLKTNRVTPQKDGLSF